MTTRKNNNKWTEFWDMHSGGGLKEKWHYIYIEAPEEEAKVIFYNRFGHNPERVSCTCCGDDYVMRESESLEQITAFHRHCRYAYFKNGKEISQEEGWKPFVGLLPGVKDKYLEEAGEFGHYVTLQQFKKQEDVLIIRAKDIKPKEREGEVPEQGYVWKD